ncbi:MAG: dTDP-4-dehydrorhamnose reductase [Vampirovibrio sp.]|jgi:dTDP-4-dehydrorhamnose reductase|nr:dTDP-4-dehydrorhamnose reductase [Vampirovibrio sp.]
MGFKNIVVTGARGMLGQDLVPYLRAKGYDVFPTASDTLSLLETADSMQEKLEPFSPQVIIHAAAYTNVDGAEREPELTMAVNKDGTRNLALAAKALGAILVYVSTDYVFDGLKQEPYLPTDRPNPINMYGLSKYYGELMVSELMEEYYVVRTSWLYGIHRQNFVQWVLDQARTGCEIKAVTDWVGSPTWTGNLCVAIETIMNSGAFGIYHGADHGAISRYEQAKAICRAAGLSDGHVRPISSSDLNMAANRPHYSVLACPELSVPSWETGLQAYLAQYCQQSPAS